MNPRVMSATAVVAIGLLLAACGTVPVQKQRREAQALLAPAAGTLTPAPADATSAERELQSLLAAPLDVAGAVRIAWLRNPDALAAYARLGVAGADVFMASRPANPQLSLGLLWPANAADGRKLEGSLGFSLQNLLWLHARRQAGAAELRSAEQQLAASLYALALDTTDAWFDAVAAQQHLSLRQRIADSAGVAAELAEQYRLAGNINALSASLQSAAGAEARISLDTAIRAASRSRARLRQLLGLTAADPAITLPASLPAPEAPIAEAATLHAQARSQRLDLAAARSETEAATIRLAATRRYRLVNGAELAAVTEHEGERTRRTGASAGIALPLFSQGQGAVARATAELQGAQARVRSIEVAIDAEIDALLEQLAAGREQYARYREQLIPQREAVVARLTEQANFMLIGPFDLLLARQQSYSAYEGAVDSLQSWWQERIALTRSLGAPLLLPAAAKE